MNFEPPTSNEPKAPQIYFAPFQGITDHIYRNAHRKIYGGIDKYFTPYVSKLEGNLHSQKKFDDLKPEWNDVKTVVPQVLSMDPAEILLMAKYIADWGYEELNWNTGCPWPQVTRKSRGAGLIDKPELVKEILDKVFAGINIKFSIKTRIGNHEPDEIFRLIEVLNEYPFSEIIIHPRTATQLYKGKADVELYKLAIKGSEKTFIYNGDIFDYSFMDQHFKEQYPEGIMLGRGILTNPALANEIKAKDDSGEEKKLLLLSEFSMQLINDSLLAGKSESGVLSKLKEVWFYFSHSFEKPTEVFRIIRKTGSIDELIKEIKSICREFNLAANQQFIEFRDSR